MDTLNNFNDPGGHPSGDGAQTGLARPRRLMVSLVATALSATVACLASSSALGANANSATTIVGNASAGKSLFVAKCGTCHTLKAAATLGTLGPNLGTVAPTLSETTIIAAITNGGASVMTKAAVAKYAVSMPADKDIISTADIENIAAFVYTSTHATVVVVAKASVSSFTPTKAKAGTKVTITGKNFTGASLVKIDGLKATFKVVSSTKITATVPAKAKSGKISVTTKAGTATSVKSLTVS